MVDFAQARQMMVDGQVRTNDVTDPRIIGAMLDLPRERFVPAGQAAIAYLDRDLPVNAAGAPPRCLLKPMLLAKMIQALDLGSNDRVLDVACATGYSSAVLGRLAANVVGLEEDANLAAAAKSVLADLGAANVSGATGQFAAGWPSGAPYDAILVNGAVEIAPKALLGQLADGGRLVCVLGRGPAGKATLYRSVGGDISARPIFDAAAPLLAEFIKPEEFVF